MNEKQVETILGLAILKLELRAERRLKCVHAPNQASPYTNACNAAFGCTGVAANDEYWDCPVAEQSSADFAHKMTMFAQFFYACCSLFRKSKHFAERTRNRLLSREFIGFALAFTLVFPCDNMSGTPQPYTVTLKFAECLLAILSYGQNGIYAIDW
ncbi:hypothetical protein [Chitinibacter sp. ZOR0017]|uniref:hypothetical protein n=1 Tax=Chitinibacter sp. ZOR0017 TaxID=1339254 RepID=UPI0012E0346D|nr:hypothetical protein [Chitinibacter sp. ZOR0017]